MHRNSNVETQLYLGKFITIESVRMQRVVEFNRVALRELSLSLILFFLFHCLTMFFATFLY